MTIRPATADDVPQVISLVEKTYALHIAWDAAKFGVEKDFARGYGKWLVNRAGDPRSVFLVASRGDKIVAFLIATVDREIPIYLLKEFGFIHDLWVEPDYRHEGLARQLTMLAIEKFRAMGVRQIRLDTAIANDAARGLFTSCGFRPSITEMLIELS